MLPEHQQAWSNEHLAGEFVSISQNQFVPVPEHPPYEELSPDTQPELPP